MIEYDIISEKSIGIKIAKGVSRKDMDSLAFSVEALTAGNPETSIRFQLADGLSMKWVKYVERLCENIPNYNSIGRVPGSAKTTLVRN